MKNFLIPITLLLAGIFFLIPALAARTGGKINLSGRQRIGSLAIGGILLLVTLCLYLFIPAVENPSKPGTPNILGVTIKKGQENGAIVYDQAINFRDEDGNTNRVEWDLVNLSDPAQQQYIQLQNEAVVAPPEQQKVKARISKTWYCEGHQYVATIEVSLVDSDGNRSRRVRYTINCE